MAHGSRYNVAFKRRRQGKTDYKARLKIISLETPRLVVRITNNHTIAQIIGVSSSGDETLVSAHSKELENMGWQASGKNIPAAYLTGYLCGRKAMKEGISKANLDIGLRSSTRGSRVFATLKGALDAGINIPHQEGILPSEDRIRGENLAEYAQSLSEDDLEQKFSNYLKKGLSPTDIPEHFETIKKKIEEEVSL